jgi:hypothetical protein
VILIMFIMIIVCNNMLIRLVYAMVSSQGIGGGFVSWIKDLAG